MKQHKSFIMKAIAALLLALAPLSASYAAASIAVMPFDYSTKQVKSRSTIVKQGRNGSVWVLKTKEQMTIELETHEFTNKLITSLVKENKFDVVERQKLDRLLDEQKLGTSGLADPTRAAKVGKLLGADYFIMAEISVFDGSYSSKYFKALRRYNINRRISLVVDVRVVDTTTGKIVYSEAVNASQDFPSKLATAPSAGRITREQVDMVERQLCKKIVRGIVDTVFPIKVIKHSSNGVIYLNRGSNGGVQVGNVYKAVEQGESLVDEDTGLVLGAEESPVAIIRVTETQKKFSKATMVKWISARPQGLIKKGAICRPFNGELPAAPPPKPVDRTAPSIRFIQPQANDIVTDAAYTVIVDVPDADTASVTINGQATTRQGTQYSLNVTLNSGANTFSASATDQTGNSSSASATVTLDNMPPSLRIVSPMPGSILNTNPVEVIVECADTDLSQLTINGQAARQEGTQFHAQITLSEGSNTVQATATDLAGNQASESASYTLDTTPPTVSILSPKQGQTLNGNPVNVWVEAMDAVSVTINGQPATPKNKNRYMLPMTAKEGQNTVSVTATDSAGNQASAQTTFIFDSTPPDLTASAEVIITGKVDDPNSTVTINGRPVKVKADGTYRAKVKLDKSRKVTIIATDEFGNKKTVVKQY